MQNLNSIERFLFNGSVYLLEKSSKVKNDKNLHLNIINKEENSNSESEKDSELIPLKLLSSLLNLYFYSKNPKKSFEQLKPYYSKIEQPVKKKKMPRLSSIKSQATVFASDSNFFMDEDISIDSNAKRRK